MNAYQDIVRLEKEAKARGLTLGTLATKAGFHSNLLYAAKCHAKKDKTMKVTADAPSRKKINALLARTKIVKPELLPKGAQMVLPLDTARLGSMKPKAAATPKRSHHKKKLNGNGNGHDKGYTAAPAVEVMDRLRPVWEAVEPMRKNSRACDTLVDIITSRLKGLSVMQLALILSDLPEDGMQ